MENNFLATDVNKLGVNTPTAQEQFKRGSDRIKQVMPNGIIPNAGIQGQVLNAIAQSSLQETAQTQDVVMGALNIQSAVGVQVDQLLEPFGMPRRLATSTIVELTITSSENTVIPKLKQILNIDTQDTYIFNADTTILKNVPTNCTVLAIQTGELICPVNSSWGWYQTMPTITNVTNVYEGSPGLPQETDFMYKYRIASYQGQQARSGSYFQLRAILDALFGSIVENYQLYQNNDPYNYETVAPNFELPPSSYFLAVQLKSETPPAPETSWNQLTEAIGGQRIQTRMIAPNEENKHKQVIVSTNISFNGSTELNHQVQQRFIANYTLTVPARLDNPDKYGTDNYFLCLRIFYTNYSTTPPYETLLQQIKKVCYNNFLGVFADNVPPPEPYRIFLGSTIDALRFSVSVQALNVLGLNPIPQLGIMTKIGVEWLSDSKINTTIFQNWRLLQSNIELVQQ